MSVQPVQAVIPTPVEVTVPAAHIARVRGELLTELPLDLYIPPDALEVFFDAFEGPMDLLLYLVRRDEVDITRLPIARITAQFLQFFGVICRQNIPDNVGTA